MSLADDKKGNSIMKGNRVFHWKADSEEVKVSFSEKFVASRILTSLYPYQHWKRKTLPPFFLPNG